jgi:hypothetical protein
MVPSSVTTYALNTSPVTRYFTATPLIIALHLLQLKCSALN